jgi:hypothetical protein
MQWFGTAQAMKVTFSDMMRASRPGCQTPDWQRYMDTALARGVSPQGRANDSAGVRIDVGGKLQDFARGCDNHQLPGFDHNELSISIPKVKEKPDLLSSTVAVLRLVPAMLRWGLIRHAAPVTLSDWFRLGAELHG